MLEFIVLTFNKPPDSSQFERSDNKHATGVHDQLFSQVILALPAAFHGGKVLEVESVSITPHRPKINHQKIDPKNQTNTINS